LSCDCSADQKLQDIVDKIFPELEENDEKLEKEFYATHGFKRKASTITGSSTGTDYHMSKSNQKRAKKSSSSSTALTAPCPSNEIKSISELTFQVRPFKRYVVGTKLYKNIQLIIFTPILIVLRVAGHHRSKYSIYLISKHIISTR
jgi:hypothetical protein